MPHESNPISRRLLETRHGVLHVWRTPSVEDGLPLVCLHMSPQSGRQFHPLARLLAGERELIMIDRLGFGYSDPVAERRPFPEYARASLDAVDGLDIGRFDLLGIHTGTSEAVALREEAPERVRSVVLAALPVFSNEELHQFRSTYAHPPAVEEDGSHFAVIWERFRRWQGETPSWPTELTNERVLDDVRAWPSSAPTYASLFDYEIGERLRQISQPLLVMAPRDDIWVQTQRGLELLPEHAEVVDMSHLTHEIFAVHADTIAGHLRGFLGALTE